jgi:hypothetical protein
MGALNKHTSLYSVGASPVLSLVTTDYWLQRKSNGDLPDASSSFAFLVDFYCY